MLQMSNNWFLTHTGKAFDFNAIEDNEYCLEDIARSLSQTNRYGGHTSWPYSVAQHSVLMADAIYLETDDPNLALDCLFHDATEAYLGDMKTPLKNMMPSYREMENRVDAAIRKAFARMGVPAEMFPKTKEYDTRILLDEKFALLSPTGPKWGIELDGTEPLGVLVAWWSSDTAYCEWLLSVDKYSRKQLQWELRHAIG